ncbi:4-hydroxyphenylpyruvate dioxygenase [Persicimonas caeni]|uniref:4-hydroxyphenylpyruvate dioxygenase n=1 Tax=Persicimonas caeni TaxID=2292766 RepID=A0A4Y6PY54_PERCE|nr:VOC family protein [Persicimonas caeni]QDG53183.1 4-hydroxyphenylpyruvate dioxygenase [Persicimonas caeni]QED34405.1 4-hydroxyphenylpyruvate dioxygenase [Persicimonas caeni]
MADIKNLGILGYDGLRFVSLDLDRSREFYTDKLGFTQIAQSTPQWEEQTGDRAEVFHAGDVTIEVIESQRDDSFGAYHRQFHPAGIATVNFRVRDAQEAWDRLEERGATFIDEMEVDEVDGGRYRRFEIASPLGNATFGFVEKTEYTGYAPGFEDLDHDETNEFAIGAIDHLTSNMRTLKPYIDWYTDVLGMEKFWEIAFHTSDVNPDAGVGSGLKSIVTWDAESGTKFANNEPMRPFFNRSQIQKYLEDFGGPGVQHAAFEVEDIIETVRELRERGIDFLYTPSTYYETRPETLAEQGVDEIDEDWQVLEDLGILVDGSDDGYLLQIFMKEAALFYDEPEAGPFFIELIQRKGDKGFGGGNFRALFEAIERDQLGELAGTSE